MKDITSSDTLDYVDSSISIDVKYLNAFEYIIRLEFLWNSCIKNHNDTGNAHTIWNQINDLEKFRANEFSDKK